MNQETPRKVLCFHGFGTNADVLNFQLKQFKEEFKNLEFVTQDGPIKINKEIFMDERLAKVIEDKNIYSWGSMLILRQDNYYEIFALGIQQAIEILQTQGPFYAIMGFSQGSNIVSKLSNLIHSGYWKSIDISKVKLNYRIKCFIFVSGLPFQAKAGYENFNLYKTPSLHFIGVNDFLAAQSMALVSQYLNPFTIYHNQGHKIPTMTYEQIKLVRRFLEQTDTEEWSKMLYVPKL